MFRKILAFVAISFSAPAFAFLCEGESVRCIDYSYNPGFEFVTYAANRCGSYVDYHSGSPGRPGVTVYYAYCSEHPCGGRTIDCTSYGTNTSTTQTFVNADSCRNGFGYCSAE